MTNISDLFKSSHQYLCNKKYFYVFLGLLILSTPALHAQTIIKGSVEDALTKEPVTGASVIVKSTTNGTSTDVNGAFTLQVTKDLPVTLSIRLIGYKSQEIDVYDAEEPVIVSLSEDLNALDEIVVTGLATKIKRSNLANAVTSISVNDLTGAVTPQTLDNALYGKIPGANIRENSGAPGGGLSVQLRGLSSLQETSQPLYIIDGVYLNNEVLRTGRSTLTGAGGAGEDDASNRIADLNPDDIENIEVLKGPSASAIYGTRANAGVIIITTKKGKSGKTQIRFSQDIGFSQLLKKVGAASWDENKIKLFFPASRQELESQRLNESIANGGPVDFEDLLYGEKGLIRSTNLNISGGNDKTKFYVSGNTSEEKGIIKNTGFKRFSIRLNIDHQLSSRINFSINSNYLNTDSDRGFMGNQNVSGSSIGYILGYTPNYYDPRPVNGVYPDNPYADQNPLELRDKAINNAIVNRFIQAGKINFTFLRNENASLDLALQGGIDYLTQRSLQYLPEYLQMQRSQQYPGDLVIGNTTNVNTNGQAFLIYAQQAKKINFTTQAGLVGLRTEAKTLFNRGRGLVSNQKNLSQATVQSLLQHYDQKVQDFSIVGQEEVNYDDKIIGTLGIRFDKSTLNGDANKYYVFPKASIAANLNNFSFWTSRSVSLLKLRAAYGQTGGLPPFGAIYTSLSPTVTGGLLGSVVSSTAGNPEIKPERAGELEVGFDIGFLSNKILFDATYYNKNVTDLIQNLTLAGSSGISTKRVNAADLRNRGFEFALTVVPVSTKNITWSNKFLYWSNRSKITKLNVPWYVSGIYGAAYGTYLFKEGYSPTTIVGNPRDEEGNYTVYGNSQPDFQTSWSSNISFLNGFEFSFLLDWKKGGEVMNITLYNTDNGGTTPDWNDDWNNDGTPNGKDREGKGTAGVYVQDGGYLKLREVALKYTIPRKTLANVVGNVVNRVQVGLTANNLYTYSAYKGYDPEISSFGTTATNVGSDLFNYPPSKRFLFNLQIGF
jgi:TonB-linked SusC/RagA family outer membrane protein